MRKMTLSAAEFSLLEKKGRVIINRGSRRYLIYDNGNEILKKYFIEEVENSEGYLG